MGLAYVFAFVVGMGILTIQAFLGSKDADSDTDHDFDKDFSLEGDGDADADADADADGDADAEGEGAIHAEGDHHDAGMGLGGLVALFFSVRFWVFASLGFGLSGTLLHYLSSVGASATFITALVLGLTSGLTAAYAFRLLKRTASHQAEDAGSAVGQVARVIVPVGDNRTGKIRIQLGGQSVDLVAKSGGLRIERGDLVVIEEMEGEVAQVSPAPEELKYLEPPR